MTKIGFSGGAIERGKNTTFFAIASFFGLIPPPKKLPLFKITPYYIYENQSVVLKLRIKEGGI